MNTKLVRSVVSLVAILGLGTGVSYALITSDTVSIATTNATSATADLDICDTTAGAPTWDNSVSGLTLDGILPGEEFVMTMDDIYLGNDGGALPTNVCANPTIGSSDAILDIIPAVTTPSCGGGLTNADLSLKFSFDGVESGFANLDAWAANTGTLDTNLAVNGFTPVKITALLNSNVTQQNATCTFGVSFKGQQS